MTQLGCVGVESNEARSLLGLTAGVRGHNSSSDPTQRKKLPLSERAHKPPLEISATYQSLKKIPTAKEYLGTRKLPVRT